MVFFGTPFAAGVGNKIYKKLLYDCYYIEKGID